MIECGYGKTILVTTTQGSEEMQVMLGGSGVIKS